MKLEDTGNIETSLVAIGPKPDEGELVGVLPRTLGVRALRKTNDKGEVVTSITGVYGGRAGNVWVASFADEPEAQAWILASNYMGAMVKGIVIPDIATIQVERSIGMVYDPKSVHNPELDKGPAGGPVDQKHFMDRNEDVYGAGVPSREPTDESR